MKPTVESSVLAFPRLEQRSPSSQFTLEEVERAVKLAAEDLRVNWLKSHASSPRVCARTRLINAAMVSDLSDNAFRVLCLQLSYTNGTLLRTAIGNETIAALARCSERTVKRSNKELEDKKWVSVSRKRRDVAVRNMAIPEEVLAQIGTEIMENFPPRLVSGTPDQDWTEMSGQAVSPGKNGTQEVPNLSLQDDFGEFLEVPFLSSQEVLPGQKPSQEVPNLSLQEAATGQVGTQEVPNLSLQDDLETYFTGVKPPYLGSNSDLRSAKFDTLICKEKTKRKNNKGAELVCIQSGREAIDEARPPEVEKNLGTNAKAASVLAASFVAAAAVASPVAAAPIEPPAIVQQAPQIPECWDTPQARQNAFLRAAEARAQREVIITPDGCLEALGGFRSELRDKFPLVELTCGLLAAAPNVKPYMTAIETMATIRRQFAYMQVDAKRKADRDAAISASYKSKLDKKPEREIIAYDTDGSPVYRGR